MTEPAPLTPEPQTRRERVRHRARRTRVYVLTTLLALALVYLIALIVANTRHVKVSWVFGSGSTSLIWLIVVPAFLGWIVGLATAGLLRRRMRRAR